MRSIATSKDVQTESVEPVKMLHYMAKRDFADVIKVIDL